MQPASDSPVRAAVPVAEATNRAAIAVIALCATLLQAGAAAAADDLPTRKPGLWEISIAGDGAPPQNARHCIDEKTDRAMQEMGRGMGGACSKQSMRKEGDRWVSDSECKFGPTTVTSHSVTTGDVSSALRTEVDAKYNPPMAGRATSKTVVTAKWSGACPAGWKPGDMEMAGMGRVNLESMRGMMRPQAK